MDRLKLARLKRKLERLRAQVANLKRADILGFAESIGRVSRKGGKEGVFVSILLPYSMPMSIPKHRTFNKFTAGNILDSFEKDLNELEDKLENE